MPTDKNVLTLLWKEDSEAANLKLIYSIIERALARFWMNCIFCVLRGLLSSFRLNYEHYPSICTTNAQCIKRHNYFNCLQVIYTVHIWLEGYGSTLRHCSNLYFIIFGICLLFGFLLYFVLTLLLELIYIYLSMFSMNWLEISCSIQCLREMHVWVCILMTSIDPQLFLDLMN